MKLLKKISENSKKKFKEMQKKINVNKDYTLDFDKLNGENKIIFKDGKKIKLIGDFNFYGIYNNETGIWTWANVIPDVDLDKVKLIEKLRLKSIMFENNIDSSPVNVFFYQFLANDNMLIPQKYMGLIIDLLLYLNDDLYILNPINSQNNLQYIGLSKILELH